MKLKQQIIDTNKKMKELIEELGKRIKDLPDNPRIVRLNSNCFIIKSGDLGHNWTPEHHDFKAQYKMIVEDLNKSDNVLDKLEQIIREKKIKRGINYLNLHADVVRHLESLL